MSETKQFKLLSPEEARNIAQANSSQRELEKVADIIKSHAARGYYYIEGVSVAAIHLHAIARSLRGAGYRIEYSSAPEQGLNINWEDVT